MWRSQVWGTPRSNIFEVPSLNNSRKTACADSELYDILQFLHANVEGEKTYLTSGPIPYWSFSINYSVIIPHVDSLAARSTDSVVNYTINE
jgi:hypothetical protein